MRKAAAITGLLLLTALAGGCESSPMKKYLRIFGHDIVRGDLRSAVDSVEKYAEKHPGSILPAKCLDNIALRYYLREQRIECIEVLERIVAMYPHSDDAADSYLFMGQCHEELGNVEKAVESYKKAATFDLSPSADGATGNLEYAADTRDIAGGCLAELLEKAGRLEEALKWYKLWRPRSWCGTCLDQAEARRDKAIVRLLISLGRREEALKMLDNLAQGIDVRYHHSDLAVSYVDLKCEEGVEHSAIETEFRALLEKSGSNTFARIGLVYLALLKAYDSGDMKTLLNAVMGEDEFVRCKDWYEAAAAKLLKKKPDEALEVLLQRLVKREHLIIYLLGELGDKRAIEPLAQLLFEEEEEALAREIHKALVKLGKDSVPGLIKCLDARHFWGRLEAACALWEIGDVRAVEPLIEHLHKDKINKGTVSLALAGIGDKRAIPPLMEILLAENKDSFRVLDAVKKLTHQSFGLDDCRSPGEEKEAYARWRAWWERNKDKYP